MTRFAPIKPGEPVTRMVLPFRLMGVLLILIVLIGEGSDPGRWY